MGQSERGRVFRQSRQTYETRLYASAFGAAVLCRLRRKNAVGLEYAERHSLFQLQLRNTFALRLVRLFQSFHHRSGIREDRLERCERQSAKNRCRRTGIQERELKRTERRVAELDKLISAAFEEKVAGKIPENVCLQLIDKYTAEQTELKDRISYLTQGLEEKQRAATDVDEFIRRMKKHINAPELTRELCLELFEKLVIGGKETVTGKPQEVHIYYKIDIDSIL